MTKPPSHSKPPTSTQSDLKNALECQIDIVLRLEEERLLLLKENKTAK